MLSYYLKIVNF